MIRLFDGAMGFYCNGFQAKYLRTLVNIYHLIKEAKRKAFSLFISTLKKYSILDDN